MTRMLMDFDEDLLAQAAAWKLNACSRQEASTAID